MKVIAKISRNKYVCEVSHTEIEKFLNMYYSDLKKLEVGSEIDLAKGYNFAADAKKAMTDTAKLIESNKEVIEAIISGISLFGVKKDEMLLDESGERSIFDDVDE